MGDRDRTPASICALNFGTTDPFDASTLPNRTEDQAAYAACLRTGPPGHGRAPWQYISAKRLVRPSIDTGSIALSVEFITIALARRRAPHRQR